MVEKIFMHSRYWIFFMIAANLLAACVAPPTHNQPYYEMAAQAQSLMHSGRPKQAAKLYQNLADFNPQQQNQFRLLAAGALIQSGDTEKAKAYADEVKISVLSTQQRDQLNLIYAQISLNTGDAEQALERLNTISVSQLSLEDQQKFYQAEAFAYSLTGNLLASVKARIKLGNLLLINQQIKDNDTAILETLSLLSPQTLQANQSSAPEILGGWIAIARLFKQKSLNGTELAAGINEWRQKYPHHPANSDFLQDYLSVLRQPFKQPQSIAVLLPESGVYAAAGRAVRAGIMAAYSNQQKTSDQPEIIFYDNSQDDVISVYEQAVNHGAEMIIGPLSKKNIERLSTLDELNIPVLALNYVDNLRRVNLYQFGLSPLDDTRQIIEKARMDGHRKALILIPGNKHGERIAGYLNDDWQNMGGRVLKIQAYNPQKYDFSSPIKNMLNLDESEQRYRQLRHLLARRLEFVPRLRHDVDAIFLSANPRLGRSINPQLRFYHASKIPVYATGHIYSGQLNATLDIDLNNITFCSIPWFFAESGQGQLSLANIRGSLQQIPARYLQLVALGIDAYHLIPHLGTLDRQKYQGASGHLFLNMENRIVRQLVCAKFIAGIPVSSGFIPLDEQGQPNLPAEDDKQMDSFSPDSDAE